MTALISATKGTKCLGMCTAKCYNSKLKRCTCVCLGLNHGQGLDYARFRTEHHFHLLVKQWSRNDPKVVLLRGHGHLATPPPKQNP